MQNSSIVQWFSSGKPLTVVLIARMYESGELQLDDRVTRFIPEFGAEGKAGITIFHLLTHTGGFRAADDLPRHAGWPEAIERICQTPIEKGWVPGEKAGYSTQAGWFILAEILQRITGKKFDEFIRSDLLEPLGMNDSWLRLPVEKHAEYADRISVMYNTAGGRRDPAPLQDANGMAICRPGASGRGPVSELAWFYQMLLNGGELNGYRCLKPETVGLFTSPHRVGLYDNTFMHTLDFGLGFIVNSNSYGVETVPYGYGRHASPGAFGHSGAQSSVGFADPAHNLAVAWVANGMPGERLHQMRQREINSAIYEFLELGKSSVPA
jgi:CubicO group peptidase (beta-lactamase class C family)